MRSSGSRVSSFQNAGWMTRLWSLAKPGDPVAQYVTNVQLVNDMRYRSSRERAPYGRVTNTTPAPGAGEHAGWELRGDDQLGNPLMLLHHVRAVSGAGVVVAALAVPTAALIADRTASTFMFQETDRELSLTVNTLSTAVGDLPTSFPLPPDVGVTAAWQGLFPFTPALPFAASWNAGQSLYVFALTADQVVQIDAAIQAVRA